VPLGTGHCSIVKSSIKAVNYVSPVCLYSKYVITQLTDIGVLTKSNHSTAETDWDILKVCKIDVNFYVVVVDVFTLLSDHSRKTSTV
jgi:hypothetical protein